MEDCYDERDGGYKGEEERDTNKYRLNTEGNVTLYVFTVLNINNVYVFIFQYSEFQPEPKKNRWKADTSKDLMIFLQIIILQSKLDSERRVVSMSSLLWLNPCVVSA